MGTDQMDRYEPGEYLRSLRERADISETELARRVGVHQTTISKVEKGTHRNLPLRKYGSLAVAAGGELREACQVWADAQIRAVVAEFGARDNLRDDNGGTGGLLHVLRQTLDCFTPRTAVQVAA